MSTLSGNQAFVAYAASLLVLSLNLLFLWAYSGAVRGKTKTAPNPEDGRTVLETDPPEVARVLRAHSNAMANIIPFALVGLVFVLTGGSGTVAVGLFSLFTVARLAHSFAYLAGKQPWRSIFFGLGLLATLILFGFAARALFAA